VATLPNSGGQSRRLLLGLEDDAGDAARGAADPGAGQVAAHGGLVRRGLAREDLFTSDRYTDLGDGATYQSIRLDVRPTG
jgi:hypothetical protein